MVKLSLNDSLALRVACDGESSSGKSTATKLISKKYKLFCMNSGLLFRYASRLIIEEKPKKIIPFLRKKFKNLNYKYITRLNLHSQEISNHVVFLARQKRVREIIRIFQKKINANIKIKNLRKVSGELVGSITASSSKLKPIIVSKDIGKFIDELPILFVIAALTKGVSRFKNVGDLKHKESNRLLESKKILVQVGIKCKTTKDSIIIYGKDKIETQSKSILSKTKGDHRICMSSTILSLVTGISAKIKNFETVNTSFPEFISLIKNLGGKIVIK